ncbi:MAG: hypothetical protein M3Y83_14660 [Actinomycetota bacterium]|nr:hypothetical protein [Actinomycetota bacterium]
MVGVGDVTRRGGSRFVTGKIFWLIVTATGDLADPIARDLLCDGKEFDDLGWRNLWAYITAAPPNTAIHYARSDGLTLSDHLAAEQLYEARKLGWRYTAMHFEGGTNVPFPEPISLLGDGDSENEPAVTWDNATLDDLMPQHVRDMMKGG